MRSSMGDNDITEDATTVYQYDAAENLIKQHYVAYPFGGRPGIEDRDYLYEHGLLVKWYRRIGDGVNIGWSDSTRYHYDSQNRITEELLYANGASVVPYKETHYSYLDHATEITKNGLSNGNWGDWVTLERKTQNYSDDGVLLNVETEYYSNPTTLESYSYDSEGRTTSILTQTLDDGEWVNTKLLEYSFDGEGHLVLAEIKTWQKEEFVHSNRAVYELNEAGYPVVVNFEKWNGEEWVQGTWKAGFYVFSEPYLDRQNAFLCRRDAEHIEISYASTAFPTYEAEELTAEQVFATLHPNPSNGQITITGKDLRQAEVFNTLGQRILTVTGEGETLSLNLAGLPAGIYFVNITDSEGHKCVKKVVKE